MTKTLTEQWREGTLERGCYFIKLYGETELVACYNNICDTFHTDIATYTTSVKQVLARVPSYNEWKQMIDGDKATIHHLKKILPMIEYNKVAYDYLKKVIEDMEKDLKEEE